MSKINFKYVAERVRRLNDYHNNVAKIKIGVIDDHSDEAEEVAEIIENLIESIRSKRESVEKLYNLAQSLKSRYFSSSHITDVLSFDYIDKLRTNQMYISISIVAATSGGDYGYE